MINEPLDTKMTLKRITLTVPVPAIMPRFTCDDQHRHVSVIKLNYDDYQGFIPSKVMFNGTSLTLFFYQCDSLPSHVRPFDETKEQCYVVVFPQPDALVYDSQHRVLIDQVYNAEDQTIYCTMVMGTKSAQAMLCTDESGQGWPLDEELTALYRQ